MENSYKEDAYNAFQLISNEDIDEFRIWTKEKCTIKV